MIKLTITTSKWGKGERRERKWRRARWWRRRRFACNRDWPSIERSPVVTDPMELCVFFPSSSSSSLFCFISFQLVPFRFVSNVQCTHWNIMMATRSYSIIYFLRIFLFFSFFLYYICLLSWSRARALPSKRECVCVMFPWACQCTPKLVFLNRNEKRVTACITI